MNQGFDVRRNSSRVATVRQWGASFVEAVQRNEPSLEHRLSQLGGLPRSESAALAESVGELCRANAMEYPFETARRMQMYGARATVLFGLSFSGESLNGDIAPSLLGVVTDPRDSRRFPRGTVQLAAIQALGHVSPLLSDELGERICETVLSYSMSRRDLNGYAEILAVSNFENLFRADPFGTRSESSAQTFRLSLRVIERMLKTTTESLAEANTEYECEQAIDTLTLARLAGAAWLTLLPTIASSGDTEVQELMVRVLEHSEWLVNRPHGFPGYFFGEGSVREFEAARSLLSLSLGIASLCDPMYQQMISELALNPTWLAKAPETVGNTLLRAVLTADVEAVRERYQQSIPLYVDSIGRAGLRAEGQDTMEACALAWHVGSVEPVVLVETLENLYDPHAQFYLTKAIRHPLPWS
jgi:hypothetical protein